MPSDLITYTIKRKDHLRQLMSVHESKQYNMLGTHVLSSDQLGV